MKTVNQELLREIFNRGLVSGIGTLEQTCIEGAIALACGEGLTDCPSCVAEPDRAWAIRINDAPWSSPTARAEALYPIAIAQTGTAGTDRTAWVRAVALGTITRVLPIVLDAVGLPDHAKACREAKDLESARAAAYAARAAADAARAAADAAAARAAAYAADARAAADAARAAADAARGAANAAYAVAARGAANAAYAVAAAARAAAYAVAAAARAAAYAADARAAADARGAANAAYAVADAAYAVADADQILREAVAVALDTYRAEGRDPHQANMRVDGWCEECVR